MKLTRAQIQEFQDRGVLVVEGLLKDEDLAPAIAGIGAWIDRRAKELLAQGKVTSAFENEDFEHRYARLQAEFPEVGGGLDIMNSRLPALFDFLRNARLMEAVEGLVGPEILCSPIQHLRAKPPAAKTAEKYHYNVPWHQDAGVTWQEADDSNIVTVWLPLVDATEANGCMEVIPGAHKSGYLEHQAEGGTTIVPALMPKLPVRRAEVRKGGVIFMHRYMPHRSTDNKTDGVRWSIDLRYQPIGQPTGRPFHPAFVVQSKADPASVCTSHEEWCRRWTQDLETSKGVHWHRTKPKPKPELVGSGKM